jgi:hypothetical protein
LGVNLKKKIPKAALGRAQKPVVRCLRDSAYGLKTVQSNADDRQHPRSGHIWALLLSVSRRGGLSLLAGSLSLYFKDSAVSLGLTILVGPDWQMSQKSRFIPSRSLRCDQKGGHPTFGDGHLNW